MKTRSIKTSINLAGAMVVALGLASAGVGLLISFSLSHALEASARTGAMLRNHMEADMMHDALHSDVLAAVMSADPANGISIGDVKKDLEDHVQTFEAALDANGALVRTPEERQALADLKTPLEAYVGAARAIIEQAETDPAGAKAAMPGFKSQFSTLEDLMEAAGDKIEASAQTASDKAISKSRRSHILMFAVLGAAGAFALGLVFLARRILVEPIVAVTRATDRLAGGDLTVTPPYAERRDEIGAMARALGAFKEAMAGRQSEAEAAEQRRQIETERRYAEEIRAKAEAEQNAAMSAVSEALECLARGDLTHRIDDAIPASYRKLKDDFNQAIRQLEETMQVILDHAEGIKSGAGEISHASDDLSRRTERQAATLEETAAAVEEITTTVRKSADGARAADAAVTEAKTDAERGGEVAAQAIAAMSEIEASSSQIGRIIGVIDEIAFQTNLLALNAGVEAARAGESGKGFAVVASEVRALAQRSAQAAQEIKDLVEVSGRNVATGVDLVGQTGEALSLIVGKVGEINTLVRQIAASSQDQAAALGEVNLAVNEMDQVTQQNAAMVEQSTAASHSLARDALDLSSLVGRFRISPAIDTRRRAA